MQIVDLIDVLQREFARNGNVTVYLDHETPIDSLGLDDDGTFSINGDKGAIEDKEK